VGSNPTPGTGGCCVSTFHLPVLILSARVGQKGRGTRAGGWGRGEEPGPGPTTNEAGSFSKDTTFPHRLNPVPKV